MKFCEECGAKLEDEAMFCDECGAKIEFIESAPAYEEPAPTPVVEEKVVPTPVVEEKVQPTPTPVAQKDNNQKTGAKSGKLGIIIGAAAAAVVVIAVVLIIVLSGGSDEPMTTADSEQTSVEQSSAFEDYVNKSKETMAAEEAKRLEEEQKEAEEAKRLEEEQQATEEMKRLEEEKKAAEEELARLQEENKALQEDIQQSTAEDAPKSSTAVPAEYNRMLTDGAAGNRVPVHFNGKWAEFLGSYDNGEEYIFLMDGYENLPVYICIHYLNEEYIYMDGDGYIDTRGILYGTTSGYYNGVYFPEMPLVWVYCDYMFPNSDSSYLDEMTLWSYTKDELRIGRNEIFARHGRIFASEDLDGYFRSQDWYAPRYTSDEFDSMVTLNAYEKANIDLMKQIEDSMLY